MLGATGAAVDRTELLQIIAVLQQAKGSINAVVDTLSGRPGAVLSLKSVVADHEKAIVAYPSKVQCPRSPKGETRPADVSGCAEQARPLAGREKSDCAEAGLRLSLTKPGCRFALKTPSFWAMRAASLAP